MPCKAISPLLTSPKRDPGVRERGISSEIILNPTDDFNIDCSLDMATPPVILFTIEFPKRAPRVKNGCRGVKDKCLGSDPLICSFTPLGRGNRFLSEVIVKMRDMSRYAKQRSIHLFVYFVNAKLYNVVPWEQFMNNHVLVY